MRPNDTIGPYKLVSKLGRGAFGVVWLAEKSTAITTTKVAIKIPNDEEVDLEAVKQEASVWVHASGHPNVLPIIDADIHDGHIIIVSEYAPDGSLTKWLESHGGRAPSVEEAIRMTDGILAGLEHLHRRGIIHRDLKPDNILLQGDTPRLADFGIARILKTTSKSTIATGTPAYMPPEAFDGKRSEQTDIWSVGAIFYQLLSGQLPFPQSEMTSLIGAIITREPEPLPDSIPSPIQEVIQKALQKNQAHRYKFAGEMRKVLREAIQPRPYSGDMTAKTEVLPRNDAELMPTLMQETPKSKRVVPPTAAAATLASPTLASPSVEQQLSIKTASSFGAFDAVEQPVKKPNIVAWFISGGFLLALIILVIVLVNRTNNSTTATKTASASSQQTQIKRVLQGHTGRIIVTTFSPDGKLIASVGWDGTARLWDAETGAPVRTISKGEDKMWSLCFSPDGSTIATGSSVSLGSRLLNHVRLWDARTGELLRTLDVDIGNVIGVSISPDSSLIAGVTNEKSIWVWDFKTGALKYNHRNENSNSLAFSPDSKLLATGGSNQIVVWDALTGQIKKQISGAVGVVTSVAFSPDGQLLAGGTDAGDAIAWSTRTWEIKQYVIKTPMYSGLDDINSISFSPDGRMLAAGTEDMKIKLSNVETGNSIQTFDAPSKVTSVAFSPNNKTLVSGGWDNMVRLWDASNLK